MKERQSNMATPLQNISPNHKLINFNAPNYLIQNFDNLVRFKRVSRTSMLVHLIETYCRSEQKRLKEDNQLNQMVVELTDRNATPTKVDWEPPMIPYSSDDDWEDRLMKL